MHCANCGAPLELADGRTILTCGYCRSLQRLDGSFADQDRIVSLDRPADTNCPRCDVDLVEAAIDGQPAKYCTTCRGVLIETPVFAEVTRKRRAGYRGPEMIPQPYDAELFEQVVDCPRCGRNMDVHHHCGAGRAVIDSCHHCHLVWLDNSELTSIERTPGRR